MRPRRGDITQFIGDVLVGESDIRRKEAAGWIVVVIDMEDDEVVSGYGPSPTPEAALILAGKFDADPHSGVKPADGDVGWRHVVVPLFDIPKEPAMTENKLTNIKLTFGGWYDSVAVDGEPLSPKESQEVWNHSPDGFAWGYGGSGPAQLALAILLRVTGNNDVAVELHQQFKNEFVALWPQEGDGEYDIPVAAWVKKNSSSE